MLLSGPPRAAAVISHYLSAIGSPMRQREEKIDYKGNILTTSPSFVFGDRYILPP